MSLRIIESEHFVHVPHRENKSGHTIVHISKWHSHTHTHTHTHRKDINRVNDWSAPIEVCQFISFDSIFLDFSPGKQPQFVNWQISRHYPDREFGDIIPIHLNTHAVLFMDAHFQFISFHSSEWKLVVDKNAIEIRSATNCVKVNYGHFQTNE